MHRDNWDDLRYVLAVAESGSVSAAARSLSVNHATVLRRIAAFEDRQGVAVFERGPLGYVVSPDKLRVIEAAREVEIAVDAVGQALQGAAAQLTGTVRITSTDTLCTTILPGILERIRQSSPNLRVELSCTNAQLDLSRLHADLSVRPALRLGDDLIGARAGDLAMAVYGATGQDNGRWLGLRGVLERSIAAAWMKNNLPEDIAQDGADSFLVLREMVAEGLGNSFLPLCIGESDQRVQRLEAAAPIIRVPLWVASHVDLVDAPRLRAIRHRLAQEIIAMGPLLAGDST